MDGSYQNDRDTSSQNHVGGQNVLFVDGHVTFKNNNYVSNEMADNIFTEDSWHADTDSYISDRDHASTATNVGRDAPNSSSYGNQGQSTDEYTDLD